MLNNYSFSQKIIGLVLCISLFFDYSAQAQSRPKYRTFDGTLNNLSYPSFGKSGIPLFREMPADYADGKNSLAGSSRPTPRLLSNKLSNEPEDAHNKREMAGLFYIWGQFIDHDMTLTPTGTEKAPISLPSDEKIFSNPIPFTRSAPHPGTGVSNPREQTNLQTSWIDGSQVYGYNTQIANWLRTFSGGKMKVSAGNLLPFNTLSGEYDSPLDPNAPKMDDDNGRTKKTFAAGDPRAAEHPGLTSLHTLFVREHNKICDRLKSQYYGMSDEDIYQKARKEVGALIQQITYGQWLGAMGIQLNGYSGYNANARPDIMNTFSTASYRWHTMVENDIIFRNNDCNGVGPSELPLKEVFFNISIVRKYDIGILLKGLSVHRQYETDLRVNSGLRNFLFGPGSGLDLVSLNIQRGRDHGLPNYNKVRQFYTGSSAYSFYDIAGSSKTSVSSISGGSASYVADVMQSVYSNNLNNIDLWVGLYAEPLLSGKSVGRTVDAIFRSQFQNLRDGDYYYFMNDPEMAADRYRIQTTRLGDIIGRNSNAGNFQDNVFFRKYCSSNGDDIAHYSCASSPVFDGWTYVGSAGSKKYYKWNGSDATFDEARILVKRLGGHLPQVSNYLENNTLKNCLGGKGTWLDLNRVSTLLYYSQWQYSNIFDVNDNVIQGAYSPYYNWNLGEPNNYGGVENRAEITGNGYWNDISANSLRAVIAEVPCSGSTNYVSTGNYVPTTTVFTWGIPNYTSLTSSWGFGSFIYFSQKDEALTMNVQAEPNRAHIEWVNNTGLKNDYFTVEKMNNSIGEFEKLEIVNSVSKDNNPIHYSTYDNAPTEGDNTYRIRLTFQDGTSTVTEHKTVQYKGLLDFRVFPNPANDVISIDLTNYKNQSVKVHLYDYLGQLKLVKEIDKVGSQMVDFDVSEQPAGSFMVRVTSKGKRDVTKSVQIIH